MHPLDLFYLSMSSRDSRLIRRFRLGSVEGVASSCGNSMVVECLEGTVLGSCSVTPVCRSPPIRRHLMSPVPSRNKYSTHVEHIRAQ